MPELAEVEFYRRQWNCGIGEKILRVHLNAAKRIFRGLDTSSLARKLPGTTLLASETHGKQMTFRFSRNAWLGIHLGMTGELRVGPPDYTPQKHDHLVLFQRARALVFDDARQFGRVLFHHGKGEPPWWADRPPQVMSRHFTLDYLRQRLARHRTLPLKAALLDQSSFPGIGNWMADEILWQARLHPRGAAGSLNEKQLKALRDTVRFVSRRALATVSTRIGERGFGDPPRGWLFHERWGRHGKCPRDGAALKQETIGGRTTSWCPKCQRK